MVVKDIDKYFSFEILRRGYDYYKKGKVRRITKLTDGFVAEVNGSEEYEVQIIFSKNKYDMQCTCPYAEDHNCKHMAAVLYCLKNNDMPIYKDKLLIKSEEITNFQKFKKDYRKEYNKKFHNRMYIHQNEFEDYVNIVNKFIEIGIEHIKNNIELAYEIFEFLVMEVDLIEVYNIYAEKETLFASLFESFRDLFENELIFVKFLAFIGTIYTINNDEYYFEHKEKMLDLLYHYLNHKWQAEDTLILLGNLDKDKRIYDYQRVNIKLKIIYINYYFINEEMAIEIAEKNLNIKEVCEFLLNIYQKNETKKIQLLEKMICTNKGYSNQKYYLNLINIYKKKDKVKYLELLNNYFIEHPNMDTYHEIKGNYAKDNWDKIKLSYLEKIKDSKIYLDICVEEGYYDELIQRLEQQMIENIDIYLDLLAHHKPKKILKVYKDKLIIEIDRASCRQHYQKILGYFNNMLRIPHGKDELANIILYIRKKYKNRKALQEEINFYEETYL